MSGAATAAPTMNPDNQSGVSTTAKAAVPVGKKVDGDEVFIRLNKFNSHLSSKNSKWAPISKVVNSLQSNTSSFNTSIESKCSVSNETIKVFENCTSGRGNKSNNCFDRQIFNQTGAINDGNTTTNATSNSSQQSQYQFQYQEEFNRMRERLFRVLSKVPIQVDTINTSSFQDASCSTNHSSSNSGSTNRNKISKPQVCNREPLIIKYYSERSLPDVLELHFGCSLIKHNFERKLALDAHLIKEGSCEVNLPSLAGAKYTCPVAQSKAQYALDDTIHGSIDNRQVFEYNHHQQQQQQQQDHQQQFVYAEWHHQVTSAPQTSGCNFQWQVQARETLEQKAQKLSGSPCADFGTRHINSISNHRRLATPITVMKETNQHHHNQTKKPLLANGTTEVIKARQRRSVKQQQLMARPGGSGSNGSVDTSSSISTSSSSRTDVASPIITTPTIYRQQSDKARCFNQGNEPPSSVADNGQYMDEIIVANQLQSTMNTFNSEPDIAFHHNLYNSTSQQADHNHNIQLHLHKQSASCQYQPPMHEAAQTSMIVPFDSSAHLMPTQFNLQSAIEQPDHSKTEAIIFRPQMHHDLGPIKHHNNGQQIIYEQHSNGRPALEQVHLLQQQERNQTLTIFNSDQPVQYYMTAIHPQQTGGDFQQPLESSVDDSLTTNDWGQSCPLRTEQLHNGQPPQQQMIEQQLVSGISSDDYGRDRGFYTTPGEYSLLYANNNRQSQLQVELNGSVESPHNHHHQQQPHHHLNNHAIGPS